MAYEKILGKLSEYRTMKAIALDRKGLEALVEGRFNKTLWDIRGQFRASMEKEFRFENRRVDLSTDTESDSFDSFGTQEPNTAAVGAKIIV